MSGTKRHTLSVRGASYQVWERGSGRTLVFIHGFSGAARDFLPFFRTLSTSWRCLAIDLPGHGNTVVGNDRGRYSMRSTAQDLKEITEHLGAHHPVLVGYSLGGRVALSCACLYPAWPSALILESASPGLATEKEREQRRAADEGLATRLEQAGISEFMKYWERIPLFSTQSRLTAQALRRQSRVRMSQQADELAASLRSAGTGAQPSWWDEIAGLSMPTLLLTGQQDDKFTRIAYEMRQRMPFAEHVVVKDAGHNVHLEQPGVWVREIQAFMNREFQM